MYPINSLLSANFQVQNMIINCSTMLSITITMLKARPSPCILLNHNLKPEGHKLKRSTRTAHQKSTFCTLVVFWYSVRNPCALARHRGSEHCISNNITIYIHVKEMYRYLPVFLCLLSRLGGI